MPASFKTALIAPFFLFSASAYAANVFESPSEPASLIELFTSEGCSSCPPAEERLSHYLDSPALWKTEVPVAYHVDYWNSSGWNDALSSPEYTQRERNYSDEWGSDTVYTPMFAVNGREFRAWPLLPAPKNTVKTQGILRAEFLGEGRWKLSYAPKTPLKQRATIRAHAALLGFGITSDVTGGENAGRRLRHDFAVLADAHAPLKKDEQGLEIIFLLLPKPGMPAAESLGVAFWVTPDSGGEVLQATGGFLKEGKTDG